MMKRAMLTFAALTLTLFCLSVPALAGEMDGVMMKGGKMMTMQDGKTTGAMTKEMTMSNGTKVMTDGSVMMKDGEKMQMKDGQMIDMSGKMMDHGKMMDDEKMKN
jgi:hypothetical protein